MVHIDTMWNYVYYMHSLSYLMSQPLQDYKVYKYILGELAHGVNSGQDM